MEVKVKILGQEKGEENLSKSLARWHGKIILERIEKAELTQTEKMDLLQEMINLLEKKPPSE